MQRKKAVKKAIIILLTALLVVSVILYCAAAMIYSSNFDYRCKTGLRHAYDIIQFPEMQRQRHIFLSNKNLQLVGYLYKPADENADIKGVVVFAHGLGAGGQTGYMDIFNYMTENGYCVFAYDATGNDESEGEEIGGLPTGIADLDYAVSYTKSLEETSGLPIYLMGYSWGGLSVLNVLNYHPDVNAVVSLSGFNRSINLIEDRAVSMAGEKAKMLLPFAYMYEYFKFGKYAACSAIEGMEKSDCGVMAIHSEDDSVVPIKYGYYTYYEHFGENERFEYKLYTDRGHDIFNDYRGNLDLELMADIVAFFEEYK